MSKYIRTKDSIYLIQKDISYGGNQIYKVYNHDFAIIGNHKVADNIEDLCDEFIVIGYYKNKPLHFDTLLEAQQFVYNNGCKDEDYIEIKGGIWTDKGFIYTSEINNEGVLELL